MRTMLRRIVFVAVLTLSLTSSLATSAAAATPWEEKSGFARFLYWTGAVVANVMPGVSALVSPLCLPGYIVCKATFALGSVFAAGDQLFMSGGADTEQTRAILYRGWEGNWFVTGKDVAGETKPDPFPKPPPPSSSETPGDDGFVPPPI